MQKIVFSVVVSPGRDFIPEMNGYLPLLLFSHRGSLAYLDQSKPQREDHLCGLPTSSWHKERVLPQCQGLQVRIFHSTLIPWQGFIAPHARVFHSFLAEVNFSDWPPTFFDSKLMHSQKHNQHWRLPESHCQCQLLYIYTFPFP